MVVGRRAVMLNLASAVGGIGTATAQGKTMNISFVPAAGASLPNGFSIARTGRGAQASWAAIADPAVAGGFVLGQTSTDRTDYRFPLAIYDPVSAVNLDVSVRFKPVDGRTDRAGGLAIRLTDADNYYVARANALEDNVNFYRVVQGSRRQIEGASAKVASGVWQTLGLRTEGDRFTITFNGNVLFTATDRTFSGPGKVALWTKADSVTYFDALTLRVSA
jgi:hypothetical protein